MSYISTYRDFPVCPGTGVPVGYGTYYPLGVSLETLFAWAYRVKAWSGSMECSGGAKVSMHVEGFTNKIVEIDVNESFSLAGIGASGSEEPLVCGLPTISISDQSDKTGEDEDVVENDEPLRLTRYIIRGRFSSEPGSNSALSAAFGFIIDFGNIVFSGGLYYPSISVYSNVTAAANYSNYEFDKRFGFMTHKGTSFNRHGYLDTVKNLAREDDTGTFNVNFAGHVIPFPRFKGEDPLASESNQPDGPLSQLVFDAEFESEISSISIYPTEWHPFDPGDAAPYPGKSGGGPVYDSATGAQLRNPFVIDRKPDGTFYNPLHVE